MELKRFWNRQKFLYDKERRNVGSPKGLYEYMGCIPLYKLSERVITHEEIGSHKWSPLLCTKRPFFRDLVKTLLMT
jgi:hypothetical protein